MAEVLTQIRTRPLTRTLTVVKTKIAIFHCFNALRDIDFPESESYQINTVKLPCSGMMREVVMLKAFEDGADAVLVFTCPEGSCSYLQGNLRAKKRVNKVKQILDEIGFDGRRLNLYSVPEGDQERAGQIIQNTIDQIAILGPNPAL